MTSTMTSWDLLEDLREAQDELPQAARGRRASPMRAVIGSACCIFGAQPRRTVVGVGDDVYAAYLVAVGDEVEGYEHVGGGARQQQCCGFAVDAAVADAEIGDGVPEGVADDEAGDLVPAVYRVGARRACHAAAIGPHGHVRRQGLHEGIEVTAHDGGEEPFGDPLADLRIGPVARTPGVHVLACAVGELADRRRAAVQDPGDLGVRIAEHFMEHEYRAFQRGEGFQHYQQRYGH